METSETFEVLRRPDYKYNQRFRIVVHSADIALGAGDGRFVIQFGTDHGPEREIYPRKNYQRPYDSYYDILQQYSPRYRAYARVFPGRTDLQKKIELYEWSKHIANGIIPNIKT
jgi:hypothetical protein